MVLSNAPTLPRFLKVNYKVKMSVVIGLLYISIYFVDFLNRTCAASHVINVSYTCVDPVESEIREYMLLCAVSWIVLRLKTLCRSWKPFLSSLYSL